MLVDDSTDVRALVRRRLERSGRFEVVAEGADGDQAITLVHRHRPQLLLLDTSMPRVDGIEALPTIRALCPETVIVLFTGFEDASLEARARELGASDVVPKALPLDQLPGRLTRLLGLDRTIPARRGADRLRLVTDVGRAGRSSRDGQVALDQHTEPFRGLFDRAAIGMATLTTAGRIVRANRVLAELMSATTDDLVGVDYGRLMRGRGDDLDAALDAITHGDDLAIFEHELPQSPWREAGHALVTLVPVRDTDHQALYLFAQVQDLTDRRAAQEELRRSEESFRLLVGAVTEYAIFLLDVDGNVVSWNAGAQRIKGYPANEIVGRSFRVFYLPEDRAAGHPERNLRTALREGLLSEEGWRLRRDGSQFWASVVISPVFDDRGHHVGYAKVTRDRTDQRAHEQERQGLLAQQSRVLALTAHELRSPTAVIDGAADELRALGEGPVRVDRDDVLDTIKASTERLQRLAADLVTAARLHAETLDLQRSDVSVREVLRTAVARAQALHPGPDFELRLPHDVTVHADPVRLGQCLDNLVDNAVRHGAPPITIGAEADANAIHIHVTDGGAGLPPELGPRLFEMFASAGPHGATGLGLYLVREIARRHGGEAEYRPSVDGEPSAFVVSLPRRTPR